MSINEKATVEVRINGEQAKKELNNLEKYANSLKGQIDDAYNAGDTNKMKKLERELRQTNSQIRSMKTDTQALTEVMNNLDKATPKELRATLKAINKELNSGHVRRGSAEWKYYQQQAKLVTRELQNIKDETKETTSWLNRFNDGLSKWGGLAASAAAALTGVAMTLNTIKNNRNEKEDAQHELKALTGLSDESISWLTRQAEILSTSMEQSGLRIRQSSEEILKAYMLVGSKKPELLGNKEALNAVTIEAMRLAAAAKIDLTEAVEATTVSLNMFGENADQAAKYVNVLAAGSQAGSASVAAQTATIKNAAVAAATAGVSIEELNGVIQTLAKKGIEAEPAGTALRKFFLVLQTGADDTNPKVVGLEKAIENLAAKQMSAGDIQKKFGDEAFSAASIIMDGVEDYKHFTEAVTGTSVAIQQAAINSDTASAKLEQHKNKIKEAGIELADRLNPSLSFLTGWTAKTIAALPRLIDFAIEYKSIIISSTAAITAYTIAVNAATIKTKIYTTVTKGAELATALFNKTLKLNPAGLVIGGLIALGTYLYTKLTPNTDKATEAQRKYNDELRRTQEELERYQDIEARYDNIDALNARQRNKLKEDARAERSIIEDKLSKETISFRKFYDEQKAAINKRNDVDADQKKALLRSLDAQAVQKADELEYLLNRKKKLSDIMSSIKEERPTASTSPDTGNVTTDKKENAAAIAEEIRFQDELLDLKRIYLKNDTVTQDEYNRFKEDAEKKHLDNMLKIAGLEPEKRLQIMNKLLDLQIKFKEECKKTEETEAEERSDSAFSAIDKQYNLDVEEATRRHFDSLSNEEEYYNELISLREQYYADIMSSTEISEEKKAEIQQEIEKNNLKQSEKNYKEYQHKMRETLAVYQQLGQQFGESFAQLITDSETSLGDFFRETIKLMLDALQKTMIAAVAETQIKNIATFGPLGLLKAAGEIALITAAFETAKALIGGFEDGGYTGSGTHDEPKGVVHAGEFVANRHAVNNPAVKPVLDLIDTAQRNNTVGTLSAADVSAALGHTDGGNSYSTVNNYNNDSSDIAPLVAQLYVLINRLEKRLDQPIIAYTKATGKMSVNEAQELLDKMKRNASRL